MSAACGRERAVNVIQCIEQFEGPLTNSSEKQMALYIVDSITSKGASLFLSCKVTNSGVSFHACVQQGLTEINISLVLITMMVHTHCC